MEELTLLSAWLQGVHLDDCNLFSPDDFFDKELFNAIQRGFHPAEIAVNLDRPLADVIAVMREWDGIEGIYLTALNACLKKRLNRLVVERKTSVQELSAEIMRMEQALAGAQQLPGPLTGLSDALLKDAVELRTAPLLTFGLPELDGMTHGLRPGRLYVIAARPKVGKSAFSLQLASRSVVAGAKAMFFSLEMTPAECLARLAVSAGVLSPRSAQTGEWTIDETARTKEYLGDIEQSGNLLFYGANENQLSTIQRLVHKYKPALVVVDQLSKVSLSPDANTIFERYTRITAELKRMAMIEGVAVVLLAQVKRNGDGLPTLEDLKGSGSIEEDADVVILLHRWRKTDYAGPLVFAADEVPIHLELAANRNGEPGEYDIGFYPARYRFMEKPTQHEWP